MSPELQLTVELCRRAFAPDTERAAWQLPATVDWGGLLRLVRFHGVQGLAWRSLRSLGTWPPAEIAGSLSGDAVAIAATNLRVAMESRELLSKFEGAGIALLFIKGLTLGALAYGNPYLKAAVDIDLLIDSADLAKAADLLRQSGYRTVVPQGSANEHSLHAWHRRSKESVWAKDSPPLQIDLHTRTADNRRLIPGIHVHSARQSVEIGEGIRLPTLADDELFAYLAVHGASSAWFRLKWIADFAGFLHKRTADEIEDFYRRSQQLGAGRAAGQALLLADDLFDTLQAGPALRSDLLRDREARLLHRAALRLMTGEPREPTERPLGTLTIHWTQFLLLPGFEYKLSELKRQARLLTPRLF